MNEPNQSQIDSTDKIVRNNRIKLVAIASIFILPFFGALFLFKTTNDYTLWATTNHGILITPVKPLSAFEFKLTDQSLFGLDALNGKWTLIYFSPDVCREECMKNIYHMRQVRVALGKNMPRVQRVLLFDDSDTEMQEFLKAYPNMFAANSNAAAVAAFKKQFYVNGSDQQDRIFLVDPLGNLMMAFPTHLDPRDMLKDLKKLLKTSKIG